MWLCSFKGLKKITINPSGIIKKSFEYNWLRSMPFVRRTPAIDMIQIIVSDFLFLLLMIIGWFSWHLKLSHIRASPTSNSPLKILWQISKSLSQLYLSVPLTPILNTNGSKKLSAALKHCPASLWFGKCEGSTLPDDTSEWHKLLGTGMCLGYQVKSISPGRTQSRIVLSSL